MSISREEFNLAFREAFSTEFSHIPYNEDEIDITLSDRFIRRMDKLISAQKKPYYKLVSTAAKRAAIILVALLAVFTAACSVKSIREPILKFVKEIFETVTHYSVEGDTVDTIKQACAPTYLPEGFAESSRVETDSIIKIDYTNSFGEIIEFKQTITNNSAGYFVDNESKNSSIEIINDISIEFKEKNNSKTALWTNNGYTFEINCFCDTDFETIKRIVISIK